MPEQYGGGGASDPTTTKGDIPVRGPSGLTRLGVGADGQVPVADSTQTNGVKWAVPPGIRIARTTYNPGTSVDYSTTSTALADVDTSHLYWTFTAPTSGAVDLVAEVLWKTNASNTALYLAVACSTFASGASLAQTFVIYNFDNGQSGVGNSTVLGRFPVRFPLTGLTPGQTYTFRLQFASGTSGSNVDIFVGGNGAIGSGTVALGTAILDTIAA